MEVRVRLELVQHVVMRLILCYGVILRPRQDKHFVNFTLNLFENRNEILDCLPHMT